MLYVFGGLISIFLLGGYSQLSASDSAIEDAIKECPSVQQSIFAKGQTMFSRVTKLDLALMSSDCSKLEDTTSHQQAVAAGVVTK